MSLDLGIGVIIICIVVSAVVWGILYVDSRLVDRPKSNLTYIKIIGLVNVIVVGVFLTLTWLSPSGNLGEIIQSGGGINKIPGDNVQFITKIGEEMLGGAAPF